ncbi:hypothetical protein [Microbacterium sp. KNMS]
MTARVSERTVMAEYDRALAASPYLAERIKLGAPALAKSVLRSSRARCEKRRSRLRRMGVASGGSAAVAR